MTSLAKRIKDLVGLCVRLYVGEGRVVTLIDGVCQGLQDGAVILDPSSAGERTAVLLEQVYAITQLPGLTNDGTGDSAETSEPASPPARSDPCNSVPAWAGGVRN